MVAKSPALESFRIDRPDPFVIIAPGDDTNRDVTALSCPSVAKTARSRTTTLVHFEADGLQRLVEVLGCAGDDLHIVASIHLGSLTAFPVHL